MKKRKFTWVDGLIIGVLLVLIAGTCVKFLVLNPNAQNAGTVAIEYDIKITGIRNYTTDALRVGDVIYDEQGKGAVGTISAVEISDALAVATFLDGTLEQVPLEDRYDMILTISADAIRDQSGYRVGEYNIEVNRSSVFLTKYCVVSGRVVNLREAAG